MLSGLLAPFLASLLLLTPGFAQALTVNVDTTDDAPALSACDDDAPNDCSLRGAIVAANAADEHYDIRVPAGTYLLSTPSPCQFSSIFGGEFAYESVSLCNRKDVSVIGSGADATVIDAAQLDRVFVLDKTSIVRMSGLTLTHGNQLGGTFMGGGGGAVLNHGTLTLTDVVVTANHSDAGGGGICNQGTMTAAHCTLSGNTTNGNGGGINNEHTGGFGGTSEGALDVIDSTLSDNSAGGGGGVSNAHSEVRITGSTISGNVAGGGGGIYNGDYTVHIVNSTIAGNSAFSGGGIANNFGTIDLRNVTIANNTGERTAGLTNGGIVNVANSVIGANTEVNGDGNVDCSGLLNSLDYNSIQITTGCTIGGDTAHNILGQDPALGDLALNGGATATLAPLDGSPLVDQANPATPGSGLGACAATDQRGVVRPDGVGCDIGAFERSSAFEVTAVTPSHGGRGGVVTVTVSGGGFAPDADVALQRTGFTDIVSSPRKVERAGAAISGVFDLGAADLGAWDVVVTNPDDSTAKLAAGFTVEQMRAPELFAIVLARSGARAGLPARFAVLYGNRGNVDALGVPLTLSVPATFARRFLVDVAGPPAQPGQVYNDYSEVPIEATGASSSNVEIPLLVPDVPAGSTALLNFTLTPPVDIPHGTEFDIQALIGTPFFADGSIRPDVISEAIAGAKTYAANELGVTVPAGIDAALIGYETAVFELAVAAARETLVDDLGQIRRVFSLAHFMIDLAAYIADQATMSAAGHGNEGFAGLAHRIAVALGLRVSDVIAGSMCPPCLCGLPVAEGCSCGSNCIPPIPPGGNAPRKPPKGLTPAECGDIPKHIVSADGSTCKPDGSIACPKGIGSAFSTDPFCRSYPIKEAIDPNDKTGSGGAGPQRYVPAGTPMPYMVAFENQPTATAPAQTVVVTDQLDTTVLDLETFELGPILVGDIGIHPPAGLTEFSGGADLRPTRNVVVRVDAAMDKETGIVTWRFTSLDPSTMETLTDPDGGFLPPNTDPPAGDGQVYFTILPKSGLTTGTAIRNHASIVFDFNAPIETPEWLNTVDAKAPASQVDSADFTNGIECEATDLTLHWSATDEDSGVASYAIFVSEDDGPAYAIKDATTEASMPFTAVPGRHYAFYSVAKDHAGNVEDAPAGPDFEVCAPALCGDADADGQINATDGLKTLRAAVGIGECLLCRCDVDGSGLVKATDALVVLRLAVGENLATSCGGC